MKKLFVLAWLAILLFTISYLLWHEDWKYSLPTPVPKGYSNSKPVDGAFIAGKIHATTDKPLFLHFFNPACPCSRFNIPHFKSLVNKYGDKLWFAIVVLSEKAKYTAEEIQDKFDLNIPVFFDKSIADSCGIYSTPQAVIIDAKRQLYYRGNYNKSRFCEDKNTNYAQMAIDSLLNNSIHLITDKAALKSYGCSLPNCTKRN
jgi:hypothetical protein